MVRSRTRRGGASALEELAVKAAKSPQGRALAAQAFQAAKSPQARALAAQALLGAKAVYASPMGQAAKAQLMQAAQDATGVRIPTPTPSYPNPYGRSASGSTISDATPIPTATPVAKSISEDPLSEDELALATIFVVGQRDSDFRNDVAMRAVDQAARAKNRDGSLALLDGITKLAEEVKALHDAGTPMEFKAAIVGLRNPGALAQMLPMLQVPETRARIAEYIVKANEPAPGERRFLASSINQLVVAMRNRMQQKLMLGGRTRRVTRRRGGAGLSGMFGSKPPPSLMEQLLTGSDKEQEEALRRALLLAGKQAVTSPQARALAGKALRAASDHPEAFNLAKAAYQSPQGQELKRQAMAALRDSMGGGKTRRSRRRL
jgi:hypothetical protein